MRINNNITAVNSHRQLGINRRSLGENTERLSSGTRVNRPADDSAGFSISEKMRTQIRGLNRTSLNIQDGSSSLQVGDGALQFVHDKMQRMRELAVQAANGTNDNLDRVAIQLEFGQLTSEINSVIRKTSCNGRMLFDGSTGDSGHSVWERKFILPAILPRKELVMFLTIIIEAKIDENPKQRNSADTSKHSHDRASMFRPRPSNPHPPRAHI